MQRWKNGWFYYKLISVFLILGGLLGFYLYHVISKTWIRDISGYPFSLALFQGQFFSFFTFQSNFIVGAWFLIALIFYNKKNRIIDNQNITLALTTYISVTMFVFLGLLVPIYFYNGNVVNLEDIITGPYFHILTPMLMIIYSLFNVKSFPISFKKYYSKNFFFTLIFIWVYILYLITRICIYSTIVSDLKVPFTIIFPYMFFNNFDETSRFFFYFLIILIIGTHLLLVFFNVVYFFLFKKIAAKKSFKNQLN